LIGCGIGIHSGCLDGFTRDQGRYYGRPYTWVIVQEAIKAAKGGWVRDVVVAVEEERSGGRHMKVKRSESRYEDEIGLARLRVSNL